MTLSQQSNSKISNQMTTKRNLVGREEQDPPSSAENFSFLYENV